MKKHLCTYGYLALYLVFASALDRILMLAQMGQFSEDVFGNQFILETWLWIFFAGASLAYIGFQINNLYQDNIFQIFQILLGIIGVISTLLVYTSLLEFFPFSFMWRIYTFVGSGWGNLHMALTFVAGLGLMGVMRKKDGYGEN